MKTSCSNSYYHGIIIRALSMDIPSLPLLLLRKTTAAVPQTRYFNSNINNNNNNNPLASRCHRHLFRSLQMANRKWTRRRVFG